MNFRPSRRFFLLYPPSDSFFISNQRPSSTLEILEKTQLLKNGQSIPFYQSLPSYLLARHFIRSMGEILDWSSILGEQSFIFKSFIEPNASLVAQTEVLAKLTKNQPFRLKSETEGMPLKMLICPR